jgi:hypothetical protein
MREPIRLADDQLQRLADLIADRLQTAPTASDPAPPQALVDAATLAQALGVDRSWV